MIFGYRSKKLKAVIPTASMADIAFLLIIFFIYSTTFSVDRTTVFLPSSTVRKLVEKNAAIIAITKEGEMRLSDGVHESVPISSLKELNQKVEEIVVKNPFKEFIIKCDRFSPYENFDRIYQILVDNKVKNIAILTEQKIKK